MPKTNKTRLDRARQVAESKPGDVYDGTVLTKANIDFANDLLEVYNTVLGTVNAK